MNLRLISRTNVSSGEVADVHQVHHVDKPGLSANHVRKHRDILYAHQGRHQYLQAEDHAPKQLERQRPLSEMELENRRVKEREKAIQAKAERIKTPKSKYP